MRFLAFLLTFLIGAFLATFVKAEECHRPSDTVTQLDGFTQSHKTGAVLFDNHGQWPVPGSWPS